MTDQEIVQALRCCAKGLGHDDKCENCRVGEIQNRREYIEFAAANAIERLTADNTALRYAIKPAKVKRSQEQDFNGAVAYLRALAKEQATQIEKAEAENAALREYAAMMHECEMCKNDSYCQVGAPTGGDCGNHHECDDCPCRDCEKTDHWALRELPGAPEG